MQGDKPTTDKIYFGEKKENWKIEECLKSYLWLNELSYQSLKLICFEMEIQIPLATFYVSQSFCHCCLEEQEGMQKKKMLSCRKPKSINLVICYFLFNVIRITIDNFRLDNFILMTSIFTKLIRFLTIISSLVRLNNIKLKITG